MSQRTLLLILGASIAATLAWADLKASQVKNRASIDDLIAVRSTDIFDRKLDHDLLVRVATGVEQLQRKAERDERRLNRETISHP